MNNVVKALLDDIKTRDRSIPYLSEGELLLLAQNGFGQVVGTGRGADGEIKHNTAVYLSEFSYGSGKGYPVVVRWDSGGYSFELSSSQNLNGWDLCAHCGRIYYGYVSYDERGNNVAWCHDCESDSDYAE